MRTQLLCVVGQRLRVEGTECEKLWMRTFKLLPIKIHDFLKAGVCSSLYTISTASKLILTKVCAPSWCSC